jgi:hypothetical protein
LELGLYRQFGFVFIGRSWPKACNSKGQIKAWAVAERRKDLEILQMGTNPQPDWPWATPAEFAARLKETDLKAIT